MGYRAHGTIERDLDDILTATRLSAKPVPHLNRSSSQDYRTFYCPETEIIVSRVYAEVSDHFGYSIDLP